MSDKKMIRESKNQSQQDLDYLPQMDQFWGQAYGSPTEKLEAVAKFASRQSLTKLMARWEVFQKQLHVNGSIVEVGVHRGASLMAWAQFSSILEPVNYLRKVIGFDTFEGFPSLDAKDTIGDSEHLRIGGYSAGGDAKAELQQAIDLYDSNRLMNHIGKCELIAGDASKTIPEYLEQNPHLVVSLLHLDTDLYEPTKVALEHFLPRMPRGAIIVFDELNLKQLPGETSATMEAIGIPQLRLHRLPWATSMSWAVLE